MEIFIEVVVMVFGFFVGVGGVKCICGVFLGGVMCLGYFFGWIEVKGE